MLKKYSKDDFDNYFFSSTIIHLETNNNSIFSNIDGLNVFDKKFLNKIQNKVNGLGEYNILIDFSIHTDIKQLILLTFAP